MKQVPQNKNFKGPLVNKELPKPEDKKVKTVKHDSSGKKDKR